MTPKDTYIERYPSVTLPIRSSVGSEATARCNRFREARLISPIGLDQIAPDSGDKRYFLLQIFRHNQFPELQGLGEIVQCRFVTHEEKLLGNDIDEVGRESVVYEGHAYHRRAHSEEEVRLV